MPGMRPSLSSGSPNLASSEQKITSVRRASSKPPPSATPLTPEMMGFLALSMVSWSSWNISLFQKSLALLFWNYLMLAPAQKALAILLRKRMTLTSLEAQWALTALEMADLISTERALRSEGLLRQTQPILSSTLVSTLLNLTLVWRELNNLLTCRISFQLQPRYY